MHHYSLRPALTILAGSAPRRRVEPTLAAPRRRVEPTGSAPRRRVEPTLDFLVASNVLKIFNREADSSDCFFRPPVCPSIHPIDTFQCISFSSAHASDLVCRLYLQRIWQITLPVAARVSVTCPCVRHCPGVRHMPGCVRISIRLVDVLVHILFF